MKVRMTVTREFDMDERRILSEPGFDPPAADASDDEKRDWLEESFYELCGFEREQDHVNGTYVRKTPGRDDVEVEFEWPAISEEERADRANAFYDWYQSEGRDSLA